MSYKRCRIYQNCTLLNDRVYVYSPLYLPSWPFHTLPSRVRKFRLHWYYCIHILIRILVSTASYWWNIFHSKKYSHFKGATSKYQYKVNPRLTNKSHLYTQSSFSTHQNMFSQNVCDPLSNSFNDYDYIKKNIEYNGLQHHLKFFTASMIPTHTVILYVVYIVLTLSLKWIICSIKSIPPFLLSYSVNTPL